LIGEFINDKTAPEERGKTSIFTLGAGARRSVDAGLIMNRGQPDQLVLRVQPSADE